MDFSFTDFTYLSINWINDGTGAQSIYPSGQSVDFSHGENRNCVWTWKVADAVRAGLVYAKCKRCGSNGHLIVGRQGRLKLPCNQNVFQVPGPIGMPDVPPGG